MRALLLLLSICLLSGCVTRLDGKRLDQSSGQGLYYVEHQVNDDRHLEKNIATALDQRGFSAVAGEPGNKPSQALYTVNYIDRWSWDMRMYLKELRIEIRDSRSNLVGYGESSQSSFASMGMSFDDVINRALDQMLAPQQSASAAQ